MVLQNIHPYIKDLIEKQGKKGGNKGGGPEPVNAKQKQP